MSGTGCADAASLVTSRRMPAADMFMFTDPQSHFNGQYVRRASKYSDPSPLPAVIRTYILISYFTADYIVDRAIIIVDIGPNDRSSGRHFWRSRFLIYLLARVSMLGLGNPARSGRE